MSEEQRFTISIDTGGTFTDLVLAKAGAVVGLFKSATTPDNLFDGITGALGLAAESQGVSIATLLAQTRSVVYATTHSTNAILERKLSRTALVVTRGYRDVLLYREGGKDQPHNVAIPYPEPYVQRRLTFELSERIFADGTVAVKLREGEIEELARRLKSLDVETVAICLLWSIVNPVHELRVAERLAELLPGVELSVSHKVNPIAREYRRASATAIDASIKPLMRRHLGDLDARLRELGFAGEPLMVTHVTGGVLPLSQMSDFPLQTVDSGPALAPVAALQYARPGSPIEGSDLIVADTGGTSFDVSLVYAGNLMYTREKWLGPQWYGHMTGLPAVDTQSIGAGGGSIARIDAGGLLRVGPESAGAVPGPVAYGHGGTEPTVTDAGLAIGYIDPENFLGGRMKLDLDGARAALRSRVAEPLGISVEEAAEAVITIASENMRSAIMDMTVSQGRDPRQCAIVAGGGAAGLNIVRIARSLDVPHVIIPRLAAGLSALGGQFSDLTRTFARGGTRTNTRQFDEDGVARILGELTQEADAFFAEVGTQGERSSRLLVEARYEQQIWTVDLDLGARREVRRGDLEWLRERFDALHLELFAANDPATAVELLAWRLEARVTRPKPALHDEAVDVRGVSTPTTARSAWFGGVVADTPVYGAGQDIEVGTRIDGPAVIEEATTTIVIIPGASAVVGETGYFVSVGSDDQASEQGAPALSESTR
jgi:N-methylhydantoinase A